jgi:hypothetical protein
VLDRGLVFAVPEPVRTPAFLRKYRRVQRVSLPCDSLRATSTILMKLSSGLSQERYDELRPFHQALEGYCNKLSCARLLAEPSGRGDGDQRERASRERECQALIGFCRTCTPHHTFIDSSPSVRASARPHRDQLRGITQLLAHLASMDLPTRDWWESCDALTALQSPGHREAKLRVPFFLRDLFRESMTSLGALALHARPSQYYPLINDGSGRWSRERYGALQRDLLSALGDWGIHTRPDSPRPRKQLGPSRVYQSNPTFAAPKRGAPPPTRQAKFRASRNFVRNDVWLRNTGSGGRAQQPKEW